MPRPALVASLAILAIFVAGSVRLLHPVFRSHDGGIWGDSFTYVSFARQLARNHFFFDHPIAPIIKANHREGLVVLGPIWNTSIRDDGNIVYSVAIGYPGFLAIACKAGGPWLMLHANLALTLMVLALLVLIVWEAMDRSTEGLVAACMAALILPRLDPATFNQFTYPWREPLSYVLVLSASWCVLRFRRTGRFSLLLPAGLLLGLACTVKEANFIYGVWLGLFGLLTTGMVRRPAFWVAAGGAAVTFAVGLSPLLIQNVLSSGHLFVSLQSLRETANFSITQPATGLSTGNLPDQVRNYLIMYGGIPVFRWTPVMALIGLIPALRTAGGRFLLGAMGVHLALYLQWGADFRHMFFALLPYAFLITCGACWIATKIVDRALRLLNRPETGDNAAEESPSSKPLALAACTCLLLLLAAAPRPWAGVLVPRSSVLKSSELRSIIGDLESAMPDNTIVLANRPLRDHWAVYGTRPVARLHELQEVGSLTNVYDVLDALRRNGYEPVFIDSTDRDPRNSGHIDWSVVDREWLLWRYDLNPLHSISAADVPKLHHLTDRPELTVCTVDPWTNLTSRLDLDVPPGGISFICVNPREAEADLSVTVDGVRLRGVADGYVPWTGPTTGSTVCIRVARESGKPVPAAPTVDLIGWSEPIQQETNPHAHPPDASWFPDGLTNQPPNARFRLLLSKVRLRVPVRHGPGIFQTAGLQVGAVPLSEQAFSIQFEGQNICTGLTYQSPWIPIPSDASGRVDFTTFSILDVPTDGVRLYGVHLHTAWKSLTVPPSKGSVLVGILGGIAPVSPGEGPHPWSVSIDGVPLDSGSCGSNPFKNTRGAYFVPGASQSPATVAWAGAGIVEPIIAQTGPRLTLRMDAPSRAFCASGFYPVEKSGDAFFAWTHSKARVCVPMVSGASAYRLTLSALDGCPSRNRTLTVTLGDEKRSVTLDDKLHDHILEFSPSTNYSGKALLDMSIETWSPLIDLKVPDPRDLGFQFHGLVWEPIPLHAPPRR